MESGGRDKGVVGRLSFAFLRSDLMVGGLGYFRFSLLRRMDLGGRGAWALG